MITQDFTCYSELGSGNSEVNNGRRLRLGQYEIIFISHNGKIRAYWCFGLKGIIVSKQFMNECGRLYPHINMLKYFELRIMLTQQENLYYQVKSGRPITFVNKLAATFQNLGFLLEILSILAHDYKRINSKGLKTLRWCHIF